MGLNFRIERYSEVAFLASPLALASRATFATAAAWKSLIAILAVDTCRLEREMRPPVL
jgi:hypothetical protein